MRTRLSQIWQLFNTDIRELISAETVGTAAESTSAVVEIAKTLQEQGKSLEWLKPLVENSGSLLGILCSPGVQLIGSGLQFVPVAIALFKVYRKRTKQDPCLVDCVAIISQAAYLESFAEILAQHQQLLASWQSQPKGDATLTKALQALEDFELDSESAKSAIASFPDSQLVKQYNQVLSARLQLSGLSVNEAEDFTELVARNTEIYFFNALSASRDSVKLLAELYSNGGIEVLKKYDSIRVYLETEIEPKPQETVFNETFSYRDIYVKPKARGVNANGKIDNQSETFDLETWVKNLLFDKDPKNQSQVIFIQGGPGRGKSIFCRMFADLVRRDIYRRWTPILIRLRDIEEFQPSLEETLRSRLKFDFALRDNWLIDPQTRFLFILDGFDELRIERSNNQTVERFIRQVGRFQHDCQENKSMGHRVIITGREMALHGIDRLPPNLERVEIAEMDIDLQSQWFNNWRRHSDADKAIAFQQFLQDKKHCPEALKELAKEPLLLYMLVAMHRDDELDISKFEQASGTEAKILVYEQALNWVLKIQRSDSRHPELNDELTKQKPEALRRLLAEAAVCITQLEGESASMQIVKARLQQDDEVKQLIEAAEKQLGEEALKTALSAFYIKSDGSGGVEFFHKSFREFLFAERLKQSLEDWTEPGKRGKNFNIDEQKLHWEIYDLLGYGGLTQEIVKYLMGLLVRSNEFRPVQLFQRLEDFYIRWCDGEFIDAPPENFPQKKMRLLREQGSKLGQRQVDIYAGLNVMILLLELHRYAQERDDLKQEIVFYPSGKAEEYFRTTQLLRIINYSDCFQIATFNSVVGQFLSGADLSGANLRGAVLSLADLRGTNLSGAYLSGAYLRGTNLSGAVLSGADLSGANLRGTDLSGADLSGADLSGAVLRNAGLRGADLRGADLSRTVLRKADLSRANLSGADLSRANLSGANLSDEFSGDIRWDEKTNWENVQGLDTAINVPEALKQQLGLN
ncbi:putative low-complexity protein [Cylindrospermum stagnale PCC 7417]|uniref:Putative low-complexity protein n=1 Tax=Cylindrospermum stagnale PCC 7417 TaxID=56107 RepID=K9X7L0_9NOST|nr:pentapeptide repeat-containing protein [Cylindrospermum stagnale]AFZ28084.1 putative low-complexity protein [Cylindrospermum stagnale PCC 7417]